MDGFKAIGNEHSEHFELKCSTEKFISQCQKVNSNMYPFVIVPHVVADRLSNLTHFFSTCIYHLLHQLISLPIV